MSSSKKNKQKNLIEDKYSLYIPCYDIIKKEIFFSEFFSEKIITKQKIAKGKIEKEKEKDFESMQKNLPIFLAGKLIKKTKVKSQKKKNILNEKYTKTEPSEKNYPNDFIKINTKTEINTLMTESNYRENIIKKRYINKGFDINKEKEILEKLELNWKKMKIISGFNEKYYLSENYLKYFSRPLLNKLFIPQNLNLYSYNSTSPLAKTMLNRLYINIHVYYDFESLFSFPQDKNDEYVINYIKSAFMILSQSPRQVSLFYIVDTLIKDSLKIFENYILNLLDNIDNNNSFNELIKNETDTQSGIESDEELDLKEGGDAKSNEEIKNKIYEFLLSIKKKFSILKSDLYNRFIFKFYDTEEYIYGNYTLGSYYNIRNKARQHEGINLLLQYYPLHKISPPLMSYPPILRIKQKEISYDNLFKLYLHLFPKHEIVYKLGKITYSQKNRYIKKEIKRTKYLTKYTESCDCDFPLRIKIKTLNNMNAFKKWLNSEIYNNINIHLPYFNTIKKLSLQKNNNFFRNLFCCCFSQKEEENNIKENNNIKKNINSQSYGEFMDKYNKNKKAEKELNNKLNPYNFISFYKNEKYNTFYKSLLNFIHNQNVFDFEKIDQSLDQSFEINSKEINYDLSDIYPFKKKFFPIFSLEKYPSLFIPIYIRIKIYILYGCYCIKKFYTQPYLLKDFILLNETITLDGNYCLISHLPYETRLGFTIKAFDSKLENKFILGSCQIPLYNESGLFNAGEIQYNFWPNVKIFPRVVISTPFSKIINEEKKGNINLKLPILDGNDGKIIKILDKCKENISLDFETMIRIKEEENEKKERKKKEKFNVSDDENEENEESEDNEIDNENIEDNIEENKNEKDINGVELLDDFKQNYPSIFLELPKFNRPLIHNIKAPHVYKEFLGIKYKDKDKDFLYSDFDEVRNLYADSKIDIKNVTGSLSNKHKFNIEEEQELNNEDNPENYPKDIFAYLKKTLPLLIKIIKKDPLENLTNEDIKVILICRDYILTIPSALELFLRAINWFNPLEVSIAHKYLKKWTKLSAEDALSLLDCRFPDTKVRIYAVNILRESQDEVIHNLLLILCQCLLYENFIINPLADFLIERSLKNPKLIGNYFILYNRVNMENPFFEEKLSAYILQFLMLCGNKYLNESFESILYNYYLEFFIYGFKKEKENNKNKTNKNKKNITEKSLFDYFNKAIINNKKMKLLIDPSFISYKFTDCIYIKNSNSIQTLLSFKTGKNKDSPEKKIILRLGNDLRQDILAVQILKLMDKLWLDNNFNLKLITFSICPSDIFSGYIEYVDFSELYKIQNSSGIIGVLDKEAILKFLRGTKTRKDNNNVPIDNDTYEQRIDNYIKSLSGYCVATCVLGITERTFRNVMIKDNGILLHINLGHLLGRFRYKCGIKTERSLFLLTPEMANVYISENKQEMFKKCCIKAFNILRHNASKIINPFIIMSTAGLNDFFGINDINYIKKMLVLDKMNDEDAGNYFLEQIWKCKNEKLRQIDSLFAFMK